MCTFCVCLGRGVKKHLVKWVGLLFTEQHREYFCTSMKYGPLIMEWKVHWTTCLFIQPFLFSCLLIEPMACFCVSSVIINRKKSVKTVVARFTVAVGKNMLLLIPMRPSYKPFTPPPLLYRLLSILLPSSPQLRTPRQLQTPTCCIHVNPQSPVSPRGLF